MTTTYELRVEGHLDAHWSGFLGLAFPGGVSLRHEGDGTSILTGPVADQAQLHGLLTGLRDMGATLLTVRTVAGDGTPSGDGTLSEEQRLGATTDGERWPPSPLGRIAWPRRTQRLTLRPARAADAEPTWRFRRLDVVAHWLTEVPATLESHRVTFSDPARLATTLVVELEGRVVGDLMLGVEDAWGQKEVAARALATQAELGWALDPRYQGNGYAREAVGELVRMCFEDLGLRRVVATCFAGNAPSWRLMEALGMRREQHALRDALHRSGAWLDSYGYALLATEWVPPGEAG